MDFHLILMKKYLWLILIFMMLPVFGMQVVAQEEVMENAGIVAQDTQMYTAPSEEAACIGEIKKGGRVQIISVLAHYVLIKYGDIYAYIPYPDIRSDTDYQKQYGHRKPYISPYKILITEGRIYEKSAETMMKNYLKVPEKIRRIFEEQGFRIKMTEWDVAEEAYAPYGGYHGIGMVKAVFDYERKMLYINDEWPEEIIHEMGHFVNDYLGTYSSLPENMKIYSEENGKIGYYAEENDKEFFAEAFRLYVFEPQLLQAISLDTFNMIRTAVCLIYVI